MQTNTDNRGEDRVSVELPVRLGKLHGLTRDVSASGICFEVDASFNAHSEIRFEIELETDTEKMTLKCKGSILRTEEHGKKKTVAIKITASVMEAAH